MIDGRGNTTTYGYDAAGNLTSLTDGLSDTISYGYDAMGRKVSQTNRTDASPLTPTIIWEYDGAGRMIERIGAGVTVEYDYDDNGNMTSVDDGSIEITATYDRLNRPLVIDDGINETSYDYTDIDAPEWSDPSGDYEASLDAFGRQIGLTDAHAETWSFAYRADGAVSEAENGDGTTTVLGYDPLGRLTDKATDGGDVATYAWAYNRGGVITSGDSDVDGDPGNGTTTFTYDALGRLATYARDSVTTTYGWQAVPNRDSVQVGVGSPVATTYDAANRPTSGDYASDEDGRLTARTGQGFVWDDLGRLELVENGIPETINEYTYDPLDRLVTVIGTSDLELTYVGLTTQIATITDNVSSRTTYYGNGWDGRRLAQWTPYASLEDCTIQNFTVHLF
jgi:YD repeat-containing protein